MSKINDINMVSGWYEEGDVMNWKYLQYILFALADLVMPRTCVVCGRKLEMCERSICIYCYSDIPFTHFELRSRNPMADKLNGLIERGRDAEQCHPEPYSYAIALFFYSHDAGFRKIPYQLKYHGNIEIGKYFGRLLGQKVVESGYMRDIDMVIPVPLHWLRKVKRGYNQAEIIARQIAEILGVKICTDILYRTKRTQTQTKLSVSDKLKNVAGAFSVAKKINTDNVSHLLLVDDVFTTGSTIYSCYMSLRTVFPPEVRISVACLGFVG